jgi:hypothetical protein
VEYSTRIVYSDDRSVDVVILSPSFLDAVPDGEVVDDLSPSSLPTDIAGRLVVHFQSDSTDVEVAVPTNGKRQKSQTPSRPIRNEGCDYHIDNRSFF